MLGQLGVRRALQRSTSVLERVTPRHLPALLSLERVTSSPAPPDLALKFVNLVLRCMSLELFELLPLY